MSVGQVFITSLRAILWLLNTKKSYKSRKNKFYFFYYETNKTFIFAVVGIIYVGDRGRMPRRWEHSSPLTALPTRLRKKNSLRLCASIPRSIAAQSERRKRQLLLRDDQGAGGHAVTAPSGMYSAADYKMVGVVEDTPVKSDASNNLYAFSKSKGKFLKIKETGNTMPHFSAYMKLNSANQAKEFHFVFAEDNFALTTTGIESVENTESDDNAPYYNLSGVRVSKLTKGVYIHNGKKVIIK